MFSCNLPLTLNCSEPSGKPAVLAAHNTSSSSIYLEWSAPAPATLHGQFLGFLINYRPRDTSPAQSKEIKITNPSVTVSGSDVRQ